MNKLKVHYFIETYAPPGGEKSQGKNLIFFRVSIYVASN